MLTFKDLQYLEAAARLGSVSAAAKEQFVSQPAISMSLKKAESYFNTALFVRGKHKLSLTSAGEELYPLIQSLLQLQNELFAASSTNRVYDAINVAILPIPLYKSIFYLAKVLFNQAYPNITVNIAEYDFTAVPEAGQYFFTCFSTEINDSASFNKYLHHIPHLKTTEIMTDYFSLVYNEKCSRSRPPRSPIKIGTLLSIESLKTMPIYDEKTALAHLKSLGFVYDRSIVYMNPASYDDILNYVRTDCSCFALLPQNFIRPYNNYLESLTVADIKLFTSHHYIAYDRIALEQFPPARAFLDLVLKETQKYA